jgi:two-component system phosphate regulon response regulator PhoB
MVQLKPEPLGRHHMDNTILVVEDDPDLQETLALNLQNAGYKVLRAGSIKQAEALVNTTLPHMVLLDWMLPDTPGLTFARRCAASNARAPFRSSSSRDG